MKTEILSMLRAADGYVSGQQICDRFHVSRTAVWKVIEQLKEEGYEIEAVRRRGYHLTGSPDVMSKAEIESRIETKWAGRNVFYYEETDSTNTRAKALGEEGVPHGTLAAADAQSAGKGRRGRGWESAPGKDIYMSILLKPQISPVQAPMLTLVMALSVVEAVKEETGLDAGIKWPNDLVINKKKICGILTEMSLEEEQISYVVIGVGINVNHDEFPEELAGRATSLKLESGKEWIRAKLVAQVMEKFEKNYEIFLKDGSLAGLKERYNGLLLNKEREVRVLDPKGEYTAFALGINEKGELLVERENGRRETVFSGEVSVRGIYGYV